MCESCQNAHEVVKEAFNNGKSLWFRVYSCRVQTKLNIYKIYKKKISLKFDRYLRYRPGSGH